MGYTFLKSREPYYEDPFDLGRRNRASVSYLVKQNRNLLERLCEAESKIEAFTANITEVVEELHEKIQDNEGLAEKIDALDGRVNVTESDIADLEERVAKNEDDISNNKAKITANMMSIMQNVNKIGDNMSNIDKNENMISTNMESIS